MALQDAPGRVIDGRYELVARIGEGGMATVWRGVAHGAMGFRRQVAIKRVLPELNQEPELVRMFVEEARVGSTLTHPNIVQIFDFGVDEDERYFLVMELVDGIDLGSWARALQRMGKQTPWQVVVAAALEVLRALSAAHRRVDVNGAPAPVFHRDVTPHNVLISTDGVIKLGDFGLARAMDRARTTRPDVVKGKISYLAPEIAFGEPATVGSDLYALGIVIWEMLAGRRLFDARTDAEVIRLVRFPEVPPLLRHRPDIPVALHAAVIHALEKDPAKRFASADEMRAALAKVVRARGQATDPQVIAESLREARAGARAANY